jgi:hypothetical protein
MRQLLIKVIELPTAGKARSIIIADVRQNELVAHNFVPIGDLKYLDGQRAGVVLWGK